jgi:hypothetical protein
MTAPETMQMPILGKQGETCAECGAPLAADQRYCVNCGRRRSGPRVAYEQHLLDAGGGGGGGGAGGPGAAGLAETPPPRRELSPLMTATALAALGVALLIGVLIGRGDSPEQTSAAPAVVTVGDAGTEGAGQATADTASTGTGATKKNAKAKASGKGKAVTGPTVGSLTSGEAAKSGETVVASEEALEELQNTTGAAYEEAQKKLPDKIATPGKLPPQDPGGEAGAGSGATVIK